MAILVGIDEAGYGPILGPLVVSAAAFRLPDAELKTPIWDLLNKSTCKKRHKKCGRLVIDDSKKLKSSKLKYELLQRGVLAFQMAQRGEKPPAAMGVLLDSLGVDCIDQLDQYLWYKDSVIDKRLVYEQDDIVMAANAVKENMIEQDMALLYLQSRPMLVEKYNQRVATAKNKAKVLFSLVSQHIHSLYKMYGRKENNLQFIIDKLGGRTQYRGLLQTLFPTLSMKILTEDKTLSSYELSNNEYKMRIHFAVKGDDKYLPIALASMTSKYVRELFMEALNEYFIQYAPEIRPTAGYYQDGTRFLEELEGQVEPTIIPKNKLVRIQ
jgi:ribonuclease HII